MPQTYMRATRPGEVGRMSPDAVSYSLNGRDSPGIRGTATDDQVCMPSTLSIRSGNVPIRWEGRRPQCGESRDELVRFGHAVGIDQPLDGKAVAHGHHERG